jgi:tetraprenyl-beta-curcumene synthase
MAGTVAAAWWRTRLTCAATWALTVYWLAIFPRARFELRHWEVRAAAIPDPVLRRHALHKLRTEHFTAEGAAAFAILANARSCWNVVRACVAFEVMYDYLDALAEESIADVLADNRQLYRALGAAFAPGTEPADFYAHHPQRDDGGYLQALVHACREALSTLPSQHQVLPALDRLTARAAEAQSLHHAATRHGHDALARWAEHERPAGSALHWWELAAGSGSPLGIFALIAAASRQRTPAAHAQEIEDAYFPWVAALSWLLESLVDLDDDMLSDGHSYVAHYRSSHDVAMRLASIAEHAALDLRRLPQSTRHSLLLAGMVAMNLSHRGADVPRAREASRAVREAIGGAISPLLTVLRLRRLLSRVAPLLRRASAAGA